MPDDWNAYVLVDDRNTEAGLAPRIAALAAMTFGPEEKVRDFMEQRLVALGEGHEGFIANHATDESHLARLVSGHVEWI
jgi:hypothetical protein